MFFLTFCGGSEVKPRETDNVVITLWAGTEILLSTLAEKMLRIHMVRKEGNSPARRTNVITFMGGTIAKHPTLAREIEDMKQLVESGAYTSNELMDLFTEVLRHDDLDSFECLTIMAGFAEERPSLKSEIKDLKRIAIRGVISNEEFEDLERLLRGDTGMSEVQERLRSLLSPVAARVELPRSSVYADQRLPE